LSGLDKLPSPTDPESDCITCETIV
jgi:hypothetical protein